MILIKSVESKPLAYDGGLNYEAVTIEYILITPIGNLDGFLTVNKNNVPAFSQLHDLNNYVTNKIESILKENKND